MELRSFDKNNETEIKLFESVDGDNEENDGFNKRGKNCM